MTRKRLNFGQAGEEAAVAFLKKKGYRILETNFRSAVGELDIVAEQKQTVVFIEVKTRSSPEFGHPSQAVTPAKQRKLAQVAQSFLARYKIQDRDIRFDVVSISGDPDHPKGWSLDLLPDAFQL